MKLEDLPFLKHLIENHGVESCKLFQQRHSSLHNHAYSVKLYGDTYYYSFFHGMILYCVVES